MKGKKIYFCGSCETEFDSLEDESCPNCGSGNWIFGNPDDMDKPKENIIFMDIKEK